MALREGQSRRVGRDLLLEGKLNDMTELLKRRLENVRTIEEMARSIYTDASEPVDINPLPSFTKKSLIDEIVEAFAYYRSVVAYEELAHLNK